MNSVREVKNTYVMVLASLLDTLLSQYVSSTEQESCERCNVLVSTVDEVVSTERERRTIGEVGSRRGALTS